MAESRLNQRAISPEMVVPNSTVSKEIQKKLDSSLIECLKDELKRVKEHNKTLTLEK